MCFMYVLYSTIVYTIYTIQYYIFVHVYDVKVCCMLEIHRVWSLPPATMCGVSLAHLLVGFKGQHLIRVVLLVLLRAGGKACDRFPCSHIGGVLCHTSQCHTPRPTTRALIIVHWVEEGIVGPAQQEGTQTALRSIYVCTYSTTVHQSQYTILIHSEECISVVS